MFLGERGGGGGGGGQNFVLTLGGFFNKREYSAADWTSEFGCL